MILLYKFLELSLKVILLLLIIAFERVVGFPVLFLTFSVSMMLLSRPVSRYILFIISAFLFAIFYQQAFAISFIIVFGIYFGFVAGSRLIESNFRRFLVLVLLGCLVTRYTTVLELHFWTIIQLLLGLIISSLFLLKYVFVKYGFLGAKKSW